MKDLYIDITNCPVTGKEGLIIYSDKGNLLDYFFYTLGCELLANSGIDLPKANLISEFDTHENEEVFKEILSQWYALRAIIFSDAVQGIFAVRLPKEYLFWLSNHPNQKYRAIYKTKKYDCTKDLIINLVIEDFYNECIKDDLMRSLIKIFSENDSIERFVFNLNSVTKKSQIVKDILQITNATYVPFERWKYAEPDGKKTEPTFIGKAEVINLGKQYKSIGRFSCGRSKVEDPETGLFGYIDEEGNEVIKCRYCNASDFYNDCAWTKYEEKNNYWAIINTNNEYTRIVDIHGRYFGSEIDMEIHSDLGLVLGVIDEYKFVNSYGVNSFSTYYEYEFLAVYDFNGIQLVKGDLWNKPKIENGILEYICDGETIQVDRRCKVDDSLPLVIKQKGNKYGVILDNVDSIDVIIPFEYKHIENLGDGFFHVIDEEEKSLLCRYKV